ncbi:MAG: DUF4384 domain-containing protein [Treponema sp.]|jgi:TolB-like protein|nr:DUF4384 domain-containing protein [Treponema sp.]
MKTKLLFPVLAALAVGAACATGGAGTQSGRGAPVTLDEAMETFAKHLAVKLPARAQIALVTFDADTRTLADYIFEELWNSLETVADFVMLDRKNCDLIAQELRYQTSGKVSEDSAHRIGQQFGADFIVYGKCAPLGNEYRITLYASNVETAEATIKPFNLKSDKRLAALAQQSSAAVSEDAGVNLANALYNDTGNPFRFVVRADKANGVYYDGEYMKMEIYSAQDAYLQVTHIDVKGNAQVIYPASQSDNPFIKAGETRVIPDNTAFKMTAPYGDEMILVAAYDKPFIIHNGEAAPLSAELITRGMVVEGADSTALRPVATAKAVYRINPK